MPTKQQQIINQDLQISAFLGRYDPETVKKYTETLKRIAKNAVTTLSGATDALSFAESSRLLESIRMEFTRLGDMTQANLVKDLQEVVGTQYQATSSMMVKLFPEVEVSAVVATNMPRDAFLAATDTEKEITVWSGGKKKTYTAYDEVRRITRTTVQSFERIVGEGILKGVGNRDIMKTLEKDLGIRESVAVAQIQAVARTIIAEGMEEAKNEAFKNFAPVIKGWMWNSVLDNRTSLGCASLNGKVVKKRSELPKLPRHFNCRATCSPVTDFDDVDTIIQRYHLRNKSMVERDGGANETVFKNKKTENIEIKNPKGKGGKSASDIWFDDMPDTKIMKNGNAVNWKQEYLGAARYRLYIENDLNFSDLVAKGSLRPLSIERIKKNLDLL